MGPCEQNSVKFELEYKHFRVRKCTQKVVCDMAAIVFKLQWVYWPVGNTCIAASALRCRNCRYCWQRYQSQRHGRPAMVSLITENVAQWLCAERCNSSAPCNGIAAFCINSLRPSMVCAAPIIFPNFVKLLFQWVNVKETWICFFHINALIGWTNLKLWLFKFIVQKRSYCYVDKQWNHASFVETN